MQAAITDCIGAIDVNELNNIHDYEIGLLPMIEEAGEDFDIMIDDDETAEANRGRESQQWALG